MLLLEVVGGGTVGWRLSTKEEKVLTRRLIESGWRSSKVLSMVFVKLILMLNWLELWLKCLLLLSLTLRRVGLVMRVLFLSLHLVLDVLGDWVCHWVLVLLDRLPP